MKILLILILFFTINNNVYSKLIRSFSCSQMIGHSSVIAEGEITEVNDLFFKIKINKVFKGKISSREISVEKNLEFDIYNLHKNRWNFWKTGQREIIFLNYEYDSRGCKLEDVYSLAHHFGDSEIPIINDTICLPMWLGRHSKNWEQKYIDYGRGKYYKLPPMSKRHKLEIHEFYDAFKFCIKNNRKIIRNCRKDRLKNQVIWAVSPDGTKYIGWDGYIHSEWILNHQRKSKSYERLLDEYYDGFADLSPIKWNYKTHTANTGEIIKT